MNFSILTFNVCNLRQPNRVMFGDFAWTPTQYQRKVGWLAEQIAANPVSVFAFQELWDARSLADVFATAGLAERYQLLCADDDEQMQVAFAIDREQFELIDQQWLFDFPPELDWRSDDTRYALELNITHFSRPLLKVRLKARDGRTVTLFNCHLKSRLPVPPNNERQYGVEVDHWLDVGRALAGVRRLAEACVLRLLVNRILAQSNDAVVIAGDFNDRWPSNVLDVLMGDRRFRDTAKNRSGRRANWGMYHVTQLLSREQQANINYATFYADEEVLALDHLLFSWHFHAKAAGCLHRLHELKIESRHLGSGKSYVSDHAFVRADFLSKKI